jgi:hypothetical protein
MIRIRRTRSDATPHVDDATLAMLLSGEEFAAVAQATDHLAGCAVCRGRLESADPLLALFEDVKTSLPSRRVRIPMPAPRRLPTVPPLRWQLPAGVAMAAVAAVSVLVIQQQQQPGALTQARAATDLARITTAIRIAAQHHDDAALGRALSEAKAELQHLDLARVTDDSLRAQLSALRDELDSLPPSTAAAVEGLLPAPAANDGPAPGATASQSPPADPASPAPAEAPTPAPTPADAPPPDPNPAPAPDASAPPPGDPAAPPAPDATPAPAPDATATPDPTLYGNSTDPSPPF